MRSTCFCSDADDDGGCEKSSDGRSASLLSSYGLSLDVLVASAVAAAAVLSVFPVIFLADEDDDSCLDLDLVFGVVAGF